jgi:hypothetical protein
MVVRIYCEELLSVLRGRQNLNKMVLSFVFIQLYLPTHENKVTALAQQIMKH